MQRGAGAANRKYLASPTGMPVSYSENFWYDRYATRVVSSRHNMAVPHLLRIWFFLHFITDYVFAIPLFLFPAQTLGLLGWSTVDPLATRLVAAALFAIGGISLLARSAEREVYRHLLMLKIIWSSAALLALLHALLTGSASPAIVLAAALFAFFAAVWIYYYAKLRRDASPAVLLNNKG